MQIKQVLTRGLAVSAAVLGSTCAMAQDSGEMRDFAPLLRPILQADGFTTQLRLMTPVLNATNNSNGFPTSIAVAFKVWDPTAAADAASGPVQLFQTAAKSTTWPAIPCTSAAPNSIRTDSNIKFFGRSGTGRLAMAVAMSTTCNENSGGQFKESSKVFFYSANVQTSTGGSWAKALSGSLIAANGIDLVDKTTGALGVEDGRNETFMLSTVNPGPNGPLVTVTLFDATTGNAFSNPSWKMPAAKTFGVGTGF